MRLKAAGYLLLFLLGASLVLLAPRPQAASAATDTMRLRGWNEAPISFTEPGTDMKLVSMLQLQPRTGTNETTWTALRVSKIGTLAFGDINGVQIYSTTQTTQFDPIQNTLLGSAPVDSTITFTTPQVIDTDTTTYYFVVFQLKASAAAGQTVGARITDKTRVAVGAPDAVAFISNLDSKISTIVGNPHGSPRNTNAYENTNFCSACHNVHMAKTNRRILNKLVTRDPTVVNNSSATVYNALCFSCHDGTGASNVLQYYDAGQASSNQKGQGVTSPGHMTDQTGAIDTTGYLPEISYKSGTMLPCLVCHDVHYSKWGNYALLADMLYEYAASETVDATSYWDSSSTVWGSSNETSPSIIRKRCEVCHRNHVGTSDSTSTSGTGSWVDRKSVVIGIDLGRPATHNTGAKAADSCTSCHGGNAHKITVGTLAAGSESSGDAACGTETGGCHGLSSYKPMRETSTYHHYMENADADAIFDGFKYPIKDTFTVDDTQAPERRCLMCHVDHDAFSPVANPTKGDRAMNLRSSVTTIPLPSDTSSFSDSDYINDSSGGICISCHKNSQFKNTTNQTGTAGQDSTTTPVIDRQQYADATTAHNYEATSSFEGTVTEVINRPYYFRANCVKCHNTIDNNDWPYNPAADVGSKQKSTFKFQLHSTEVRRLLAWLNITPQNSSKDPLEENFCNPCHSTDNNPFAGSNKDYYNRAAMSAASLGIKSQILKQYAHKVDAAGTRNRHKAVEGQSPNWMPRTNRHVECEDCHNVHAAKKGNHVMGESAAGGAILGTWGVTPSGWQAAMEGTATFTDTSKTVTGTGTNWLTTMASSGDWYIKNNWDERGFWYKVQSVDTNTKITLARPFNGTMMPGGWPSPAPAVSYIAAKVNYSRVDSITDEAELCLKCHSTYSFEDDPPATPSLHASGSSTSETEIGFDFSPDNLAHHPVMALGKNQPIWPTGSAPGTTSVWNNNWPKWTSGTVTVKTSGEATFSANMPVPPVRKGWYLYVTANTLTHNSTQTQNWYQISSVTSRTVAAVTPAPSSTLTAQNYILTAGLGNTFVAPWGPWSKVVCTDCHSSDQAAPEGPHGSANKWILRETTNAASFNFVFLDNAAPTTLTVSPNGVSGGSYSPIIPNWDTIRSPKNFCLNCHRRDVYGDVDGSGRFNNGNTSVNEYLLGRQPHDPTGNGGTYANGTVSKWGNWSVCMNCHGGNAMGGIHGTSVKESRNPQSSPAWQPAVPPVGPPANKPGERFLNGATWAGVRRATTGASPSCWTKVTTVPADEVNNCSKNHEGTAPSGIDLYANYDY